MKEVNYQKVKGYQRQGPSKQPHDSGADIPPVNKIPVLAAHSHKVLAVRDRALHFDT